MKHLRIAVVGLFTFILFLPVFAQRRYYHDRRTDYDVKKYILRLKVNPAKKFISGSTIIEGISLAAGMDSVVVDFADGFHIYSILDTRSGTELGYRYSDNQLAVGLVNQLVLGKRFSIQINYGGVPPQSGKRFENRAVIFSQTADGKPWIGTSCQTLGAHFWWPCKAAFFHPEDKADSIAITLIVPDTLFAVSNGKFLGTVPDTGGWKAFNWLVTHPTSTYLITMYIGPYVDLTQAVIPERGQKSITVHYYVLQKDKEKAMQEFFPRFPDELKLYTRYYGPFAFSDNKIALVQSSYPGMEHSTAVAVGPIFPHTLIPGEPNPLRWYNHYFNFMVVHEFAHEWWGNAVTALNWGDFWLHEGFATYSEALWVEHVFGSEVMHQYMAQLSFRIDSTVSVYQMRHNNASEAYHLNIYWKGAWVLHMLRYIMGDKLFFKSLKDFNADPHYRYKNITTADFQAVCEKNYGKDLSWFFLEWIYGTGWPKIQFESQIKNRQIIIHISNFSTSRTRYKMPLDVLIHTKKGNRKKRLWIEPGENNFTLRTKSSVVSINPVGLRWILNGPKLGEIWYFTDLDFVMGKFGPGLKFTEERKLFVKGDGATYISPVRRLFPGAKFLRLRLDTSQDPRWKKVKLSVREYVFRKKQQKPWQNIGADGKLPINLQNARAIEYRLDFTALRGETLSVPKVILSYK